MQNQLKETLHHLKKGNTILYPTDTVWGVGCDATNYDAVTKIYNLKQRDNSKAMICLVSDFKMLEYYIEDIPEVAYNILKYANKPTTIIYDKPRRISENIVAPNNTLAIRVVREGFANALIKAFKKPIVSTSANISGQPTPKSYSKISNAILKGVDYVVNLPNESKKTTPSSIIKLTNDGVVTVIRE